MIRIGVILGSNDATIRSAHATGEMHKAAFEAGDEDRYKMLFVEQLAQYKLARNRGSVNASMTLTVLLDNYELNHEKQELVQLVEHRVDSLIEQINADRRDMGFGQLGHMELPPSFKRLLAAQDCQGDRQCSDSLIPERYASLTVDDTTGPH